LKLTEFAVNKWYPFGQIWMVVLAQEQQYKTGIGAGRREHFISQQKEN